MEVRSVENGVLALQVAALDFDGGGVRLGVASRSSA